MSLSQKHSGKVLVPWFNTAEWRLVYDLIYSKSIKDWPNALQILKIWKQRTPLLSAGVEGTLIILEALLINTNELTSYEVGHIFSTSLVRFLNLCAANSSKQGSFYKTAMKNELPRWLINIRHDIAHSHKIPALSMLELSLKFCIQWLKGKYWDVELETMIDFVIGMGQRENNFIEDIIDFYINLGNQNKWVYKSFKQKITQYQNSIIVNGNGDLLNVGNDVLKEIINANREMSCKKISHLLIDELKMFQIQCKHDGSEEETFSKKMMERWMPLIHILHENEILLEFLNNLLDFISTSANLTYREEASLFIADIVNAFQEEIMRRPNKNKDFIVKIILNTNSFSPIFLKSTLQYCDIPNQFLEDLSILMTAYNSQNVYKSEHIYTVDDLYSNSNNDAVDRDSDEELVTPSNSRWKPIKNSTYINLPFGILPHQNRDHNPLIML